MLNIFLYIYYILMTTLYKHIHVIKTLLLLFLQFREYIFRRKKDKYYLYNKLFYNYFLIFFYFLFYYYYFFFNKK